jgi:rhodanese-related sulfurtransferase
MKPLCLEAGAVLAAGLVFALLANFVSPRGLTIGRNYFPGKNTLPMPASATNRVAAGAGSTTTTPAALVEARLKANGLEMADSNKVMQLYRDPRYELELIIFVDARDDRHYQEGHVPGAYQLDHYRVADYLAPVLAASQNAEQIVVYCNGGDCEDSEFAAITLRDAGVPREKLLVYGGGMTEWATNGLPVELGVRRSGQLKEHPK